jgi:uncharacterized protein (DUF58 family)
MNLPENQTLPSTRALVPTHRLVALATVAAIASVFTAVARLLQWPEDLLGALIAWDVGIAALALLDALLDRKVAVQVTRHLPQVLSVGRQNAAVLDIHHGGARPVTVQVNDEGAVDLLVLGLPVAVQLPAHGTVEVRYHVEPRRRGAHQLGDLWLRVPTRLGLWQRQVRVPAAQEVRVYPDLQQVRTWDLLVLQERDSLSRAIRQRGGESEFERLREYTQDDDVRHIDWRATARHRTVIARQYQLERNQNVVFALDLGRLMTAQARSGPDGEPGLSHLDHALNATLMLSHVAMRAGDHVGLVAFDAKVRTFLPPEGGPRATRRIVQACYDLFPTLVEPDYRMVFTQLRQRLRKRSLVVLFTQVLDPATQKMLVPLVRSLSPTHLPLCILLRDASVEALLEPDGERAETELDLYTRGPAAAEVQWRERLAEDMRRAGALVLHVRPEELTGRLIQRYLEVKQRQWL